VSRPVKAIRQRLICILRCDPGPERSATALASFMGETPATVSSELAKMYKAGLVARELKRGPWPLRISWRYSLPETAT
jgi:DNA-binding MarR family transcriptional regulator